MRSRAAEQDLAFSYLGTAAQIKQRATATGSVMHRDSNGDRITDQHGTVQKVEVMTAQA